MNCLRITRNFLNQFSIWWCEQVFGGTFEVVFSRDDTGSFCFVQIFF
jgi:hypothetical protein